MPDRPDIQLAEAIRVKRREAKAAITYAQAQSIVLSEDRDLAERYARFAAGIEDTAGGSQPRITLSRSLLTGETVGFVTSSGEAPPAERPAERPADVELASAIKARRAMDDVNYATARRLVLSEDPGLAQRYAEFRAGVTV